jgi:hypothetical protein
MQLTASVIKQFERDQQSHGTRTAMCNFVFQQATHLLKGIGVRRTDVTYDEKKVRRLSNRERDGIVTAVSGSPARKR